VIGTAVPEAAVDKHGDAGWAENDVCAAPQRGQRPVVDAVPEPKGMEAPPHLELRLRVPCPLPLHPAADAR